MNKKAILVVISTAVLLIGVAAAVLGLKYFRRPRTGASPKNLPQQANLAEIAPQRAIITWTTEASTYGFISYGETMSLGRTSQEAEKTTNHRVTLAGLTPETTYYYKIGVGEELFDDSGIPYSFTTPLLSSGQAPSEEAEQSRSPSLFGSAEPSEPNLAGFEAALGTTNLLYDLNGDGEVNTIDISLLLAQKGASPSATQE